MNYYNATKYVKDANEKRQKENRPFYNLSQFTKGKKFKEIKAELIKSGVKPIISKEGSHGYTHFCKELFNFLIIEENIDNTINVLKKEEFLNSSQYIVKSDENEVS